MTPEGMSLARHVRLCNAHDPAQLLPLVAGDARLGLVRRDNAAALKRFDDVFAVEDARVRLVAPGNIERVSAAVDGVVDALVGEGLVPKWRNETFDVRARWGMAPVFRLDRGAVPFFGVRAYGVHLNGYVRRGAALSLWIGRRAADKQVAPGKLDNMVAGGIASGYGAAATLAKEADEEAGIDAALIARAAPGGALTYRMETRLGVRDDVMFVYDLEVPADFMPTNRDDEIAGFELMPLDDILERIRCTDDFKFNVNLVILDFAVRHGVLRPDDPEYLEIANSLHRPLD
jgi:8-oxo-dGTP pyrophosphatase MutT (NUDIX family)